MLPCSRVNSSFPLLFRAATITVATKDNSFSFLQISCAEEYIVHTMSCNGCRVLRKGCREDCMLRQCLEWLDDAQAQANATVFVAKFFGRAGLMSSISSVPQNQRPSLFQSLLFEAAGRTVNPVSGAVGLLWTGNWHVCQTAVMTVLRDGTVESPQEFVVPGAVLDKISEYSSFRPRDPGTSFGPKAPPSLKSKTRDDALAQRSPANNTSSYNFCLMHRPRAATPSQESETTTFGSSSCSDDSGREKKLLRLFV